MSVLGVSPLSDGHRSDREEEKKRHCPTSWLLHQMHSSRQKDQETARMSEGNGRDQCRDEHLPSFEQTSSPVGESASATVNSSDGF